MGHGPLRRAASFCAGLALALGLALADPTAGPVAARTDATGAASGSPGLLARLDPDPQDLRELGPALGVLNLSGRFALRGRRDAGRLNLELWRDGRLVRRYGPLGGTSVTRTGPGGGTTTGVDSGAFVVQLVDPKRLRLADHRPGTFRIASSLLLGDGRTVYHDDIAFRDFPFELARTSVGWFGELGSGPNDAPLLYLTSSRNVYNGNSLRQVLERDPGPVLVLRLSFEK